MDYSNIPTARDLVRNFKSKGIQHIVISPGSRNAPLILSFTADSFFKCFSIVDERSAAFFALGIAQNQRRPVAVVCSSGSALLNYYPAVVEAFYSEIPLVVVSADRPPYKIDVGDGQTIRQDNVFDRHIGYSANLKLDVAHATNILEKFAPYLLANTQHAIENHNRQEVEKAIGIAVESSLPIHINIPFEEPLYGTATVENDAFVDGIVAVDGIETIEDIDSLRAIWSGSSKKMVLVGVNHPDAIEANLLENLAQDPSVLVFTETTSNLHHPNFFASVDSIIFPIEKSKERHKKFSCLQPEVLLTFGGLVVSKKIKAFLREYSPKHHWHVDKTRAFNTYFSLSRHIKTVPNHFLAQLLKKMAPVKSRYSQQWMHVKSAYQEKREHYFNNAPFSDYKTFGLVLKSIPKEYQLQLSNSSIIRYAQLFDVDPSLKVCCNRGASGIDGSTSTAVGAALFNKQPTLLITGDLSFFYDSNAFWNSYLRNDFRVVLINNSGGGIFRILPGFKPTDTFERFFEAKQEQSAYHICQHFGIGYISCTDSECLKEKLESFYRSSTQPILMEVFTPRTVNDKILLGYFDFISSEHH